MFPKPKMYRDDKYLAWIRQKPCVICGREANPHHEGFSGVALKPDDYRTYPLCFKHHRIRHDIGRDSFERLFSINSKELIIKNLMEYINLKR